MKTSTALQAARQNLPRHREQLDELIRIPSVSAPGFDPKQVQRSAQATASLFEDSGARQVRLAGKAGAHPYVIGEWIGGADRPTVLLYAHHDVQPAGYADRWSTDPFEPTLRDGRLFGRGAADDKAGIVAHAACIAAWLESTGDLPVNIKVLIEGEEEIGSPNLEAFLEDHSDELAADVLVLADAGNWSVGVPGLTYALRGLGSAVVRLQSMQGPLHSGMAGGAVPDPVMALAKMLASLTDSHGDLAVAGIWDDVRPVSANELARIRALPEIEERMRAEWGLRPGVTFSGDPRVSLHEKLWFRPSVTIVGLDSHPIAASSNQVLAEAGARISVRVAPGQDPARAMQLVEEHLRAHIPWGLDFEYNVETAVPGWMCEPTGPAFDAAEDALEAGFGSTPVYMGVGGTIPFVGPFVAAFGHIPALLVGVADPTSRIHGEDESLHLEDWRKLIESEICLLAELAVRL